MKLNRRLYLQAVLRQNVAFFDRLGAGEVTNRISNDVELIRDGISDKVSPLKSTPSQNHPSRLKSPNDRFLSGSLQSHPSSLPSSSLS